MKKLICFLLPLFSLLVLLYSCTKDNPSAPGEPAIMLVRLAGDNTVNTAAKAVGVPNPANESLVSTGVVFVFRGGSANPVLDGHGSFDFSDAGAVVPINITTGNNREVFVVANVDTTTFAAVTTRSDLYNLVNKTQLASMRTGTNLAMSGFVLNIDASAATPTIPVPVTVPLFFVGSRVSIAWDLTGLPPALSTLTVTGVYLLNVKSESDYFAPNGNLLTDNVASYLYGRSSILDFSGDYLPQPPATNTFDPELNLDDLVAGANFNNYFYVLENNDTYPTIVVIEALFDSNIYYYPIVINGGQNGSGPGSAVNNGDGTSTVKRGNIYYVRALISGLGTDDPYQPLVTGALDVTVVPAAWNPIINIDQEFN